MAALGEAGQRLSLYAADHRPAAHRNVHEADVALSNKFGDDVYDALDLRTCVAERKVIGGPAPQEVTRQIDKIEKFVADVEDEL